MTRAIGKLALIGSITLGLVACESEFASDRGRTATRSVQTPEEHNDGLGEALAGTQEGVPLVSIDLPNREGQPAKVRTIGDNIHDTFNPPATQPANVSTPGEPTTQPTHIEVNPLTGETQ